MTDLPERRWQAYASEAGDGLLTFLIFGILSISDVRFLYPNEKVKIMPISRMDFTRYTPAELANAPKKLKRYLR